MLDRTKSETPPTLGSVTYEPPPAPFEVRISSWAASTRSASRTVARLTPKSVASAASFGSRSPGCSSPCTTRSLSRSATSSYCLTATAQARPSSRFPATDVGGATDGSGCSAK
jgi:hypothetical protein